MKLAYGCEKHEILLSDFCECVSVSVCVSIEGEEKFHVDVLGFLLYPRFVSDSKSKTLISV